MNITKTNIIMERFFLKNAIKLEEERQSSDYFYSKYHARLASDYYNILCDLEDFVGYDSSNQNNDSFEDFANFISKKSFDREKPEDSFRKKYGNSEYIRALGETASYFYKNKIDAVIESKILPNEPTDSALESLYYDGIFPYDVPFDCKCLPVINVINLRQLEFKINKKISSYEITLVKPVEQLEFEQAFLIGAFKKLADEAKDEETKKTYKRYGRYASYIYEYYINISNGNFLVLPRLSNENLKEIDSNRKGSREQQIRDISKDNRALLDYFKAIQKGDTDSLDKGKKFRL